MRITVALLATLFFVNAAHADDSDRINDPYGDKLLKAGAATFTVAYAPMTVTGSVFAGIFGPVPALGQFYAPAVGPFFLVGGMAGRPGNDAVLFGSLAFLDGAAQVVGIGLMIGGAVHRHRVAAGATPTLSLR
jgi:hypothetical protein